MTQAQTVQALPRSGDALPIGTTLSGDHFTITDQIGAGGFGITYRAVDNILGRTIVIKECFSEDFCYREGLNVIARSPEYDRQFKSIVRMFMREARSLAKLKHPNIVTVHRAFEENETAYMVLDLIDGFDLFQMLGVKPSPLPPDGVVEILMQLLDAIEKVHEMDLLHRDISPDNIILENTGTPVLIDFGAARGDASRRTRAVSSLLVVKDGYSPNEFYIPGSEQTPSSDLYALAATFYHAVSGEAPVNSQARMIEVAGDRPDPCVPLEGRFDDYAPEFLKAIDLAMRVHPRDRLQSSAEWRNMIKNAGSQTGASAAKIPAASNIEISLTELIESTNDEVRRSRLIDIQPKVTQEPEKKVEVPEWVKEFNQSVSDEPTPVSIDSNGDVLQFDDVDADDFAEDIVDTSESVPTSRVPDINTAPTAPLSRPRTRVAQMVLDGNDPADSTDWVNRALEKRERERLERYEAAQSLGIDLEAAAQAKPRSRDILMSVAPLAPQEDVTVKGMIGPIVKMLFAGITIGLILFFGVIFGLPLIT